MPRFVTIPTVQGEFLVNPDQVAYLRGSPTHPGHTDIVFGAVTGGHHLLTSGLGAAEVQELLEAAPNPPQSQSEAAPAADPAPKPRRTRPKPKAA